MIVNVIKKYYKMYKKYFVISPSPTMHNVQTLNKTQTACKISKDCIYKHIHIMYLYTNPLQRRIKLLNTADCMKSIMHDNYHYY